MQCSVTSMQVVKADFVGSHQHPNVVSVVHGQANSLYKKEAVTAKGSDSVNDTV